MPMTHPQHGYKQFTLGFQLRDLEEPNLSPKSN